MNKTVLLFSVHLNMHLSTYCVFSIHAFNFVIREGLKDKISVY